MKYMDYAAMGAAFSASQRASEAFDEIDRLQSQIEELRSGAWDDREEREFQKWIEELIYQFGKVTGRIETNPGNAVEDFQEVGAYLRIIEEKKINTSVISGLENKKAFEDVFSRAEKLFGDLWNHPGVVEQRNLWGKQEEEERKREEAQEEQRVVAARKKAEEKATRLRINRYLMAIVAGLLALGQVILIAVNGENASGFFGVGLMIWGIVWWWVETKMWAQE